VLNLAMLTRFRVILAYIGLYVKSNG
jgi:hypothetical protein